MSVALLSAVLERGPRIVSEFSVMMSLADNADERGFCYPSIEYTAKRARVTTRSVIRALHSLEKDGWLRVDRKSLFKGKGNAYWINTAKLGVTVSPDARINPVESEARKSSGDTVSRKTGLSGKSVEKPRKTVGNRVKKAGVSRKPGDTVSLGQVTLTTISGDIDDSLYRRTVIESSAGTNKPPSPFPGGARSKFDGCETEGSASPPSSLPEWRQVVHSTFQDLREHLCKQEENAGPALARTKGFEGGHALWERLFGDVSVSDFAADEVSLQPVVILATDHPKVVEGGMRQFSKRIQRSLVKHAGTEVQVKIIRRIA